MLVAQKTGTALLQDILAFQCKDIVERYEDEFQLSTKDAEKLFFDTKLFLFICATAEKKEEITPTATIDNGWHEFLMFTQEYSHFCKTMLGCFIHHVPFTRKDKAQNRGSFMSVARERAGELIGEKSLSSNWYATNGNCGKCKSCTGDCCPIYD